MRTYPDPDRKSGHRRFRRRFAYKRLDPETFLWKRREKKNQEYPLNEE